MRLKLSPRPIERRISCRAFPIKMDFAYLASTIKSISYFLQTCKIFVSALSWFLSLIKTNGIFAFFATDDSVFSVPTITEIFPLISFLDLDFNIVLSQCGSFVTKTAIFF